MQGSRVWVHNNLVEATSLAGEARCCRSDGEGKHGSNPFAAGVGAGAVIHLVTRPVDVTQPPPPASPVGGATDRWSVHGAGGGPFHNGMPAGMEMSDIGSVRRTMWNGAHMMLDQAMLNQGSGFGCPVPNRTSA